jgi:hypothetical protein
MKRPPWTSLPVVALLVSGTLAAAGEKPVWQWFDGCQPTRQMHVEVLLDGKSVYSGSFPVCLLRSDEIPDESPQKVLELSFRSRSSRCVFR